MTASMTPGDDAEREAGRRAAMVDAAAALFGVAVEPGWRAPVLEGFAAVSAAAAFVAEFPLDDEAEFAPVFAA